MMHRVGGEGFGGGHPFLVLMCVLAMAGLIALAAYWFTRVRRMEHGSHAAGGAPFAASPDPALHELRLRYARGDIDRDDYLRRAADLGDVSARASANPAPPSPPPVDG